MNRFSPGSFVAGAVLAASLTVGGLALAQGEGMMGGGGMMSQMSEMMSKCNAMGGGMMWIGMAVLLLVAMLLVLGVAALLKYLFAGRKRTG